MSEELTYGRISSESLREATGRGWELIASRPGLWLGEGASIVLGEGEQYEVPPADGSPGASAGARCWR